MLKPEPERIEAFRNTVQWQYFFHVVAECPLRKIEFGNSDARLLDEVEGTVISKIEKL